MTQRHETLVAWQRADDLCVAVYKLTGQRFPPAERYGLTSQLRRASYSAAANIVEGYAYESRLTKLRFLRIAAASLAEVGYGMHLATRLEYLSPQDSAHITKSIRQAAAPLHGLIRQIVRAGKAGGAGGASGESGEGRAEQSG
jgi:four helix bundle protein